MHTVLLLYAAFCCTTDAVHAVSSAYAYADDYAAVSASASAAEMQSGIEGLCCLLWLRHATAGIWQARLTPGYKASRLRRQTSTITHRPGGAIGGHQGPEEAGQSQRGRVGVSLGEYP